MMSKSAGVTATVKRAEATIRFFEERGREAVGVTIDGSKFKLDFAQFDKDVVSLADLITVS